MNEEETIKDLKKYFKEVFKCKKCGRIYGSDKVKDKYNLCPVCEVSLKEGRKEFFSRWKR